MERYEAYKDSGVEWIGEIPERWQSRRLKTVATAFGRIGFRGYKSDDIVDENEGALTLSPSNLANEKLDLNRKVFISWDKYFESPEIQIAEADVLFTKTGSSYGKTAFVDQLPIPATINPQLLVFKNIKGPAKFFYYLTCATWFSNQVECAVVGGTIPTIAQEKISNFAITWPSLTEQQAIADYLDAKTAEIDSLVADCEREVELLKEYRKAVISEAVTQGLDSDAPMKDSGIEWIGEIPFIWGLRRLKEFCKLQTGHTPSTLRPEYFDGDVEWYTPGDIDNDVVTSSNRKVSELAVRDNQVPRFKPDSVLLVAIGGTAGKVGYAPWASSSNQQITAIMPTTSDPKWLFYSLLSMQQHLFNLAMFTTLPILSNDYLANFALPVPPRDEQLRIVAHLDSKTAEIDSLIEAKLQMADKLREYRKSLISEAVTGKFKVPGVK